MGKSKELAELGDVVTQSGGNVGIGTSSPSAKLEVAGTIKLDGNYPVGTDNVALGNLALDDVSLSGAANTGIGASALTANTSGEVNTAVGGYALADNTSGSSNSAFGVGALGDNTTGSNNTGLGKDALRFNTTASSNTAVGYQALYANTTGIDNTAVGYGSLDAATTANENTGVGRLSLSSVTTGSGNTAVGENAGNSITTGAKNTLIGRYNGNQNGLDITTSNNNIVLSDGDGNPRVRINDTGNLNIGGFVKSSVALSDLGSVFYASGLGTTRFSVTNNEFKIYDNYNGSGSALMQFRWNNVSQGYIALTSTGVSYQSTSDYRLKENVVELTGATDRLKQIPVHRFNFIADPDSTVDGFLAHEVQAIVPEAITGTKDEVDADGNPVYQGIDQSKLVPLLTAALQEALKRIDALEAQVTLERIE